MVLIGPFALLWVIIDAFFGFIRYLDARFIFRTGLDAVVLDVLRHYVPLTVTCFFLNVGFRLLAFGFACFPLFGSRSLSPEMNALICIFKVADRIMNLNLTRARNSLNKLEWMYPPLPKVHCETVPPSGRPKGYYLHVTSDPNAGIVLWFFGGAFIGGDAPSSAGFAGRLGVDVNCNVFLPAVRRAPENSIRDILQDAVEAYEWVLKEHEPKRVIVGGISSGAFLASLLLSELPRLSLPMPAGAVLFSAWLDFSADTASMTNSQDCFINPRVIEFVKSFTDKIVPDGDLKRWSPLHRSCKGFPPVLMVYSDTECCSDENALFAAKARADGVDVQEIMVLDAFHAFMVFHCWCPEALRAYMQTVHFVQQTLQAERPADINR